MGHARKFLAALIGGANGFLAVFAGWNSSPTLSQVVAAVAVAVLAGIGSAFAVTSISASSRSSSAVSNPQSQHGNASVPSESGLTVPQSLPVLRLTMWLSIATLFALSVWFNSGGIVGRFIRDSSVTALGLAAYALPTVAVAFAIRSLIPRSRKVKRKIPFVAGWRPLVRDMFPRPRSMWYLSVGRAFAIVAVAAIGFLHAVRLSPPPWAPVWQWQESMGLAGVLISGMVKAAFGWWATIIAFGIFLLYACILMANEILKNGQSTLAATAVVVLLGVTAASAYYLNDRGYRYWMTSNEDTIAVNFGLAPHLAHVRSVTGVRVDGIPDEFRPFLDGGIPVSGVAEGERVAEMVRTPFSLPLRRDFFETEIGPVRPGQCIGRTAAVPCTEAHSEEVFGLIQVPFISHPGAEMLTAFGVAACDLRLPAFLGLSRDATLIKVKAHTPNPAQWDSDVRQVLCTVVSDIKSSLGGSRSIYVDAFTADAGWHSSTYCDSVAIADEALVLKSLISWYCLGVGPLHVNTQNFGIQARVVSNSAVGFEVSLSELEDPRLADYRIECRVADACYILRKLYGEEKFAPLAAGTAPMGIDKEFVLRLVITVPDGGHLRFQLFVDDKLVAHLTESVRVEKYSSGPTYFITLLTAGTDGSTARFDDLVVKPAS